MLTVLSVGLVGTALAGPEHDSPFEPHGHVLVLGVVVDEFDEPVSVRKCVDLAANQALTLNAHHAHVHFGQAGEALARNGNFIVPVAPFGEPLFPSVPWTDCESLLAFFGF
jgi:hypothetical protein